MAKRRVFQMVAKNITYYGEQRLKWWQKIFYRPPREVNCGRASTRQKANWLKVPPHKQFGITFSNCSYTAVVTKVKL